MGYRPPAQPPKGRWARFLHRQRKARDWNQTEAFEKLREGLGLGPKSRASYLALDKGDREPRPAEADYLVGYFEEHPDDEPEPTPVGDATALVQVISDLTAELRASRLAREDVEARLRAVEAAVALRAPEADATPPRRAVPQEIAG